MPIPAVISYAAAYLCLIVTLGVLLRDRLAGRDSVVHSAVAAWMVLVAIEELCAAMSYGAVLPEDAIYWHKCVIAASGLIPAVWLALSLSYARGNAETLVSKWKWIL